MWLKLVESWRFAAELGKKAEIVGYAQPEPSSGQAGKKRNWREGRIVNKFCP